MKKEDRGQMVENRLAAIFLIKQAVLLDGSWVETRHPKPATFWNRSRKP
jgi:hypothetical protein